MKLTVYVEFNMNLYLDFYQYAVRDRLQIHDYPILQFIPLSCRPASISYCLDPTVKLFSLHCHIFILSNFADLSVKQMQKLNDSKLNSSV